MEYTKRVNRTSRGKGIITSGEPYSNKPNTLQNMNPRIDVNDLYSKITDHFPQTASRLTIYVSKNVLHEVFIVVKCYFLDSVFRLTLTGHKDNNTTNVSMSTTTSSMEALIAGFTLKEYIVNEMTAVQILLDNNININK